MLDASFEADLQEALLDDAEGKLATEFDPIVYRAIEQAHKRLRDWGRERDYNVEPIIESLVQPTVDRSDGRLTIRWGWTHDAAGYFEWGTPSNYQIDGDPVLSFVWEDPPRWVKKEFDREGDGYRVFFQNVDSGRGIAETRFTRRCIEWLRQEVRS